VEEQRIDGWWNSWWWRRWTSMCDWLQGACEVNQNVDSRHGDVHCNEPFGIFKEEHINGWARVITVKGQVPQVGWREVSGLSGCEKCLSYEKVELDKKACGFNCKSCHSSMMMALFFPLHLYYGVSVILLLTLYSTELLYVWCVLSVMCSKFVQQKLRFAIWSL